RNQVFLDLLLGARNRREVALEKHAAVVQFVAGDDVGERPDGHFAVAGLATAGPSVVGQRAEQRDSRRAHYGKPFGKNGPGAVGEVAAANVVVLLEAG